MDRVDSQLPPSPEGYDVDIPCAACGYNLRGLSLEGVCPECGTPITQTTRTNLDLLFPGRRTFSDVDPAWLHLLAHGCTLLLIAGGLVALSPLVFASALDSDRTRLLYRIVVQVLVSGGLWFLSSPEPYILFHWNQDLARSIVRIGAVLWIALLPLAAIEQLLPFPSPIGLLVAVGLIGAGLVVLCTGPCAFALLHRLASRARAYRLVVGITVVAVMQSVLFLINCDSRFDAAGIPQQPVIGSAGQFIETVLRLLGSDPRVASIQFWLLLIVSLPSAAALWILFKVRRLLLKSTEATSQKTPPNSAP